MNKREPRFDQQFIKPQEINEKIYVNRIGSVIHPFYSGFEPQKHDGYWQLDASNNWFLSFDGDLMRLWHRRSLSAEKATALVDFIKTWVNLEVVEKPQPELSKIQKLMHWWKNRHG